MIITKPHKKIKYYLIAVLIFYSFPASSQSNIKVKNSPLFPNHPVRFITPFPPGASDVVARIMGKKLGELTKQPFVIDNRSGAASTLGASIAAKANPDGYTILFSTASFAISAGYYKTLPYRSLEDFKGVGLIAKGPLMMATNVSTNVLSAREFIQLAKSKPGSLNFGSAGAGSVSHLAVERLKSLAGIQLLHVPYKGAMPALTDLIGGQIQLIFAPLGILLPLSKDGKIRALGVPSDKRSTLAPDLPTISESGLPGFEATTWYGVLAPIATPKAIIESLNEYMSLALTSPDILSQFSNLGIEASPLTASSFDAYFRQEIVNWTKTIKEAHLAPD